MMPNIRDRKTLAVAILAGVLATACVALEPGGQSGTTGGGGWPGPLPPRPAPGPERPAPEYRRGYLIAEPAPLDFGSVEVGGVAEIEGSLSNRGGADARILSVDVDGRDLRLIADGCSERRLDRGDSCMFRVRYSPRDPGPMSGGVTVFAADPSQRRFQVAVLGNARAPRRVGVDLRFSPAELSFGDVDFGEGALAVLAVRNAGQQPVRLGDLEVDGREFSIRQDGCSGEVLRPSRECRVQLVYSPTRPGRATGALRVRPEGGPGSPVLSVPLSGEGRERRGPDIRLSAQDLDFGVVATGEARILEVRVANAGRGALRLRALRAEGRGFALNSDGCSGQTLPPGRECAVAVRFGPVAPGAVQGRIEIPSDDRDERTVVVNLAGRGKDVQRCPVVQLKLRWDRDGDPAPLVVAGQLPQGECLSYALEIKRAGRLIVCVPPGYELTAREFEFVKGAECKVGDDPVPYLRYRRRGLEAGTEIKDLTLTRRDKARKQYKVLLDFRGQREGVPPEED